MTERLTDADFARAAATVGCDEAAIRAVVAVEAGGSGFFPSGRPKILYEFHYFWRNLAHDPEKQARAHAEGLAFPDWDRSRYPAGEDAMYALLGRAQDIDEEAALMSCSWGIGQVMGTNWKRSGYCSIQQLVYAMTQSEGAQLDLMVSFLLENNLGHALAAKDWATFARKYNGPGYADNNYDDKLAAAYARFA